jgi:hypothetical protein
MKKESKVSVKHYFNMRLKPVYVDKKPAYPLYVQVIYQQKSTKFKSYISHENLFAEVDNNIFKALKHEILSSYIKTDAHTISEVIKYELELMGDRFTVVGFSERYDTYFTYVLNVLDRYLNRRLENQLKRVSEKYVKAFSISYDKHQHFYLYYNILKDTPDYSEYESAFSADFLEEVEVYYNYLNYLVNTYHWKYDKYKGVYSHYPVDLTRVIDWLKNEDLRKNYKIFFQNTFSGQIEIETHVNSLKKMLLSALWEV